MHPIARREWEYLFEEVLIHIGLFKKHDLQKYPRKQYILFLSK